MLIWFMRWQEFWKKHPKKVLCCIKLPAPNDHHAHCVGFYRDVSFLKQSLMAVDLDSNISVSLAC